MLQRIKEILKKILPPPVRVFNREIARVMDALVDLRIAIDAIRGVQDQTARELLSIRKDQEKLAEELASARKELGQLLTQNAEMRHEFAQKLQAYEKTVSELSRDNAELKQRMEEQDGKMSALNHEVRCQGHRVLQTLERKDRRAANIPILSILIPVYNVEPYLRECLDSVVKQSMKELEIICVDDGSTDASGDILDEYAEKDPRIKVIHKEKNEGRLLARKTAVEAASGEYFLFVDADDFISPDLCAFAEEITYNEYADIIQFGANVCDFCNDAVKAVWLQRILMPMPKELDSQEILREAYVNRSYATALWGKLYKNHLCKKAFAALPDAYCNVGEDIFTYFYLAYYARSYKGIPTCAYYTYRHGLGVTNVDVMSLQKFELYCSMAEYAKMIYEKLICESTAPILLESYDAMVRRVSEDCCRIYATRICAADKEGAWNLLTSYWKDNPIADGSAKKILGVSLVQNQ